MYQKSYKSPIGMLYILEEDKKIVAINYNKKEISYFTKNLLIIDIYYFLIKTNDSYGFKIIVSSNVFLWTLESKISYWLASTVIVDWLSS